VPNTVKIDGVTYRNGFYGNMWTTENLTTDKDTFKVGSNEFFQTNNMQFNCMISDIGPNGCEVYCAEKQWEQAHKYYQAGKNFVYYCKIGNPQDDSTTDIHTISNADTNKFDKLIDFADSHNYDPVFNPNQKEKTQRITVPDGNSSTELTFYKESKDGFFTSCRGNTYYVIGSKLFLLYYYDCSKEPQEMLVVNIPTDLGQYFVKLASKLTAKN
jgi:hypothetical protein